MLDLSVPRMEAAINPSKSQTPAARRKQFAEAPEYLSLVESPAIVGFFESFLGGPVLTFDYKWMRLVGTGEQTGCHYDIVYMGRGTKNLFTCWTPLGDVSLPLGPLAICVGSHRFEHIKATYGQADVDRDLIDGWFSNDPIEIVDRFGGKWQTTNFRAGDVLIFGMYTMHASLTNMTNRYRVSSDTRYQLASEPVDDRWIGASPKAHAESAAQSARVLSIAESRAKFGV
jgi:ectoine hydroxylase-related dioxygenase (phytanoyl-CoA dioxygenase family)